MVITISRQFASGGAEVGRLVAEKLDWHVVDRGLIHDVAVAAGMPEDEVENREERAPGFLERLIHFTAAEQPDLFVPTTGPIEDFEESKLVRITRKLVLDLARRERVVIVGRAASAILADRADALHVRIVATRDFRIDLATRALGLDEEAAAKRLEQADAERARYYREFYDVDWNDSSHYDVVLNTSRLGLDGATDLVVARARALGWQA